MKNVVLWEEEIANMQQDIESNQLELEKHMVEIDTMTKQMNAYPNPQKELGKLNEFYIKFKSRIKDMEKEINFLTSNDTCPTCNQDITENFRELNVNKNKQNIEKLDDALLDIKSKQTTLNESLKK